MNGGRGALGGPGPPCGSPPRGARRVFLRIVFSESPLPMPHDPVDLRSDTVTRPTPGMREAMHAAELGDDVMGEDPSINRLQAQIAALLGKEAALFVPSGTMSNQIGVKVHCQPGDEVILESGCHIYNYEQGGLAQLSALATRTVDGVYGVLRCEQLRHLIRPDNIHLVRTRLVCLENTHNRGGGRVLPYEGVVEICRWAHEHGLATHLDGARLFNAVVATGISARDWASHFDTVSVCFSKGLGAPVGSAICGAAAHIAQALRYRKLFGGGMRQAGVLAAAASYALDHHVERLAEDHLRAQRLAEFIRETPSIELRPPQIDTNLVILHVAPEWGTAAEFAAQLKEQRVLVNAFGPQQIRAVTHLDLDDEDIVQAGEAIGRVARKQTGPARQPARSAYA